MRVLIVGEGPHETGTSAEPARSAALRNLVVSVVGHAHEYSLERLNSPRPETHSRWGQGRGFEKKLLQWLLFANANGYHAIVAVVDEDRDPNRVDQVNNAQAHTHTTRRAFGVAIRSFDAWMLADEKALSEVLGRAVQRQPDPEDVRDPKAKVDELRHECDCSKPMRDVYAEVMKAVRVDELEKRCPNGFAPFHRRLRAMASSHPNAA